MTTEPTRYRKKPVEVEAMRLLPGTDNWKDVCDWLAARGGEPHMVGEGAVEIETLEGVMRADPGDYVIRGIQGEFYPCKPDIFEATYDVVPSPAVLAAAAPEPQGPA
ncbi:MAG TPA: hypothetical protein VGW74_06905 [Propionibacteriaceae bacterium]|nr:hypothetical protein [Propionibacteriaceae bacterium]